MKNGKRIVAIIQARMTSTRLLGKVMMPYVGKSNMEHLVERLKKSKYTDDVVIATTTNPQDDVLVDLAKRVGCGVYRGSENNVLSRVLGAVKESKTDIMVQITGDCPLVDWRHVDHLIDLYFDGGYDYVANNMERTFPRGLDVQVYSAKTLEEVNSLTQDPVDQEHVSIYIYNHPERYKLFNWSAEGKMRRPELRITLDTKEDYELISKIFEKLLPQNPDFTAEDIIDLFDREPELANINKEIKQKNPYGEGFLPM